MEGKKNNGTNIFFKLNQKKADGPFHFLGDMEIYIIPWGAVECSIGNLHLTWPVLTFAQKVCSVQLITTMLKGD